MYGSEFRWRRGGRRTAAEKSRVTGLDGEGEAERKTREKKTTGREKPPEKIVADGADRKLFRAFRGLSDSCAFLSVVPSSLPRRAIFHPTKWRNANGKG